MKHPKLLNREARRLFGACVTDAGVDERRVREAVRLIVAAQRRGGLQVLTRFHRLVRLERARRSARIESATLVPPDIQTAIETRLKEVYGGGLAVEYVNDPSLIGGLKITVGSDVYDGTVKGALSSLADRFSLSSGGAV